MNTSKIENYELKRFYKELRSIPALLHASPNLTSRNHRELDWPRRRRRNEKDQTDKIYMKKLYFYSGVIMYNYNLNLLYHERHRIKSIFKKKSTTRPEKALSREKIRDDKFCSILPMKWLGKAKCC